MRLVDRAAMSPRAQDDSRRHFECRSICRWWTLGPFPLPTVARFRSLLSIQVRFPNLIVQRVRRTGSHRSHEGAIPAVRSGENWPSTRRSRTRSPTRPFTTASEKPRERSPSPPTWCERDRRAGTESAYTSGLVIFERRNPVRTHQILPHLGRVRDDANSPRGYDPTHLTEDLGGLRDPVYAGFADGSGGRWVANVLLDA